MALEPAIRAGIYPKDYKFKAHPVETIRDNQTLSFNGVSFRTIACPGHCAGHAAYLVEVCGRKCLFSGDLVFSGGRINIQSIADCVPLEYARSFDKVAALDFDSLFPAHHGYLLKDGKQWIKAGQNYFHALSVPPNM
jgi:glyoxylase-like metal-dependent hydrolase (beta-lactamase superfamily II)